MEQYSVRKNMEEDSHDTQIWDEELRLEKINSVVSAVKFFAYRRLILGTTIIAASIAEIFLYFFGFSWFWGYSGLANIGLGFGFILHWWRNMYPSLEHRMSIISKLNNKENFIAGWQYDVGDYQRYFEKKGFEKYSIIHLSGLILIKGTLCFTHQSHHTVFSWIRHCFPKHHYLAPSVVCSRS